MTEEETHHDKARAIQRRGHHERLTNAIARFDLIGYDPDKGDFKMALEALAMVEKQMLEAGQLI